MVHWEAPPGLVEGGREERDCGGDARGEGVREKDSESKERRFAARDTELEGGNWRCLSRGLFFFHRM